ncbi:MAG TPA: hypothetical protein VM163_13350 [bacterium]|nr:hypothetical protein [bacterium]
MTRSRWTAILLVFFLFACVCGAGYCQTWKNYVKEDGYGKLLVEGDHLWSAGALLYRFDVNTRAARVYRRGEGLPENNLSCIAIDSRGVKWLGTASRGLWLFDGAAFEPFGAQQQLGKSSIGCLAVDGDDNVWTAALGAKGLSFWDGQLVRFYGEESGLEGTIRGVTDNGDAAWCCTAKGIFRLGEEQWVKEKEKAHYEIFSDSEGNIWAANYGGSDNVVCFDGAQWSSYSVGSARSTPFGFSEAPDGSIWVGIYNGVARFDGESWTKYSPGDGMPETWAEVVDIMSTAVDANNVLWATSSMGIISFDGDTWSDLPMSFSIPMGHLMCACWTPDGLLFESYHGGRGFFDGVSWSVYSAERPGVVSGSPSMFYDQARNCVWLTGRAGHLSLFDLASRSTFKLPGDDVPLNPSGAMAFDVSGNLWVGSSMGIYRLESETWTRFSTEDGLTSNDVNGIAIAANGDIWAWAGSPYTEPTIDVNIFSEGSWRQQPIAASACTIMGLASDDQHSIWALIQTSWSPASYTVMRLDADGSLKQWPLDTGITGTLQGMFVSPRGDVWITGSFGALRFADDEWRPVTPADGLATGAIESVAFAPHNETWVCTDTALSRLDESPIPWLDLDLTGTTGTTVDFVPGDTLSLYGELHNPMAPCAVSIYVAFQLPGDETLFFWPTFSTAPTPAFTGALPDKLFWGPANLFQYSFGGFEPAGEYFVKAAIISNETGELIDEIVEAPFTFTP